MSETINVVVTATATELETALAKASSSIGKFEQRARSARQIGLPALELTPQSLQSMERGAFLQQNLARQTYAVGNAGKSGALGFLAFSQAVEDAQYGVKGVLNNIPQMILGFGGSAGLAGVISLAAVAAYGAYKAFMQLSGIDAMTKWAEQNTKATQAFTTSLNDARRAAEEMNAEFNRNDKLAQARKDALSSIQQNLSFDPAADQRRTDQQSARTRQRAAEDALSNAALSGITGVTGETGNQQGQRETDAARAKFTQQQTRQLEDLATAQENLNAITEEYGAIATRAGIVANEQYAKQDGQRKALAEETRLLAIYNAELAREVKITEEGEQADALRAAANIGRLKADIENQEIIVKQKEAELKLTDDLIAASKDATTAAATQYKEKSRSIAEIIAALKDQQKQTIALAQAEKILIRLRALKTDESSLREAADNAREVSKATNEVAKSLGDEQKILDLSLTTSVKKGDALREQLDLQDQAKKLAEGTAFTEQEIYKTLVQQNAQRKAVDRAATQQSGTVSSRAEARRDFRREDRQEKRDKRTAETFAVREKERAERRAQELERSPSARRRREKEGKDKEKVDLEGPRRKAEADAINANKDIGANIKSQLDVQKRLETLVKNLKIIPPLGP